MQRKAGSFQTRNGLTGKRESWWHGRDGHDWGDGHDEHPPVRMGWKNREERGKTPKRTFLNMAQRV